MDCSDAATMLDELALDVLPGDQRATLLHHLEECPGCRRLLDELSESADALLLAAPAATPPAGFDDRVLERVEALRTGAAAAPARATGAAPARAAVRRRPPRIQLFAAAAAAALLLAIGGLAGARLGSSDGGSTEATREFRTVRLISADGADIGDVSTYLGPPAWFFMRVEGTLANGTYQCVVDTDDGRTVAIGSLWAHDGRGAWGEHVSVDPRHVTAARLLDSHGATAATARVT